MKKKLIFLLLILFLLPINTFASNKINIYVFHQDTCIHCKHALEYLNSLNDDNITLYTYELSKIENAYNRTLYDKASKALNIKVNSVPFIVIGNNYIVGFSDEKKEEINKYIAYYKENEYKDLVGISIGIISDNDKKTIKYEDKEYIIDTLFGKVNLKELSLPIISIIMGLVDGFNPCAMWVLLLLITMLFNMKNKKKMWILGISFILTSAFMYYIFMLSWLRVSTFINSIHTLQIIVGIFAIIFAFINLYRYFKERKTDGCTVIKKEKRHYVIEKIKKIVKSKSFIISIIGIISLAIIVNLIELLCSLGLPMMFTEILSLNNLTNTKYNLYILLYLIFFMLDDIIVFVISMITLKSTAISTKYNKYSHLIGGIIMLLIGLLIIIKPSLLSFSFK